MHAAAGFAVAFVLASVPACISLVPTQAMTGRENALGLLALYCIGWVLLFAIGSFAGLRIAGVKGEKLGIGVMGCAGGGGAAGLLIACLVLLMRNHPNLMRNLPDLATPLALLVFFASPLLLPWVIGWVLLRRVK